MEQIINRETLDLIEKTNGELGFSRTTLIIGAGAHVPYGFPTSYELFENLKYMHQDFDAAELTPSQQKRYEYFHDNFDSFVRDAFEIFPLRNLYHKTIRPKKESDVTNLIRSELKRFINDLVSSRISSIDHYLSKKAQQNKVADCLIGKYLITCILRYYEKKTNFKDDWIEFFMDYFLEDEKRKKRFFESPPNIITFNYDMFFEQCILNRLTAFEEMDKQQAINLIEKINISHVYGRINSLNNSQDHEILESMNNLKIIGEKDLITQNKIKTILNRTKYLYFLGFGFNQHNMEILFPDKKYSQYWDSIERNCVCSTNINITREEVQRIQSLFKYNISPEKIDCLRLLKKRPIPLEDLSNYAVSSL